MRVSLLLACLAAIPLAAVAPVNTTDCLLVAGRCAEAQWTLESSFKLKLNPPPPVASGTYLLEGLGRGSRVLFQVPFALTRIADSPKDEKAFTFSFPITPAHYAALRALRVTENGQVLVRRDTIASLAQPQISAIREAEDKVHLTWNSTAYPEAMVRNPATGSVLAIAREGSIVISTQATKLEVILSDGVKSRTITVIPK